MKNSFGLAQVKAEGSSYLYDPDGFSSEDALTRNYKLNKRWFKTKKVRREMRDLADAIKIDMKSKLGVQGFHTDEE